MKPDLTKSDKKTRDWVISHEKMLKSKEAGKVVEERIVGRGFD